MDSPIEQSRRLQEHYASLTDDELEVLASEAFDMTEAAQQALRGEIASRRLKIELTVTRPTEEAEEMPGGIDPDSERLIELTRVWDLNEARQVMTTLQTYNVPAYLGPDLLEDVEAFAGSFEAGVEVKVRDEDQQRGLSVLGQKPPSSGEPEPDDASEPSPRCPKCHSEDIVFQGLDDKKAPEGFATSKFNWSCDSCGYQWKDDGVEAEA